MLWSGNPAGWETTLRCRTEPSLAPTGLGLPRMTRDAGIRSRSRNLLYWRTMWRYRRIRASIAPALAKHILHPDGKAITWYKFDNAHGWGRIRCCPRGYA